MKKITIIFLAVILQATLVKEAFSATAVCSGKVIQVANHAQGGIFYMRLGNNSLIGVCSLDRLSFRITPESCKSLMALAMMAKATDKTVTYYVENAPTADCASIPNWHAADTGFLVVEP